MSGKSTFLRTIGVNLVLANCGSVVASTSAKFQPRQILVSMRLDDSLADSQSYFFAEINRIKMIVEKMNQQNSFIILDEILRGTNSDDKRNGTIELLKKLKDQNATGIIATHDTEVCQLTYQYSDYFRNKCFEVEIKENDLYFDYVLRDGICQNKSATFLMKKVGIIN
jgi:DNA mismatch repair ATPase MutS